MNWMQAFRDPGAMLVAGVGAQYFVCALVFGMTERPWMGLMYIGYTIGNVAAFMMALGYK